MHSIDLTNHFLIAMPAMSDPFFAKALIFVAEHNEQGALGLIVNRPLDLTLAALLERINISFEAPTVGEFPVLFGGPVQTERGFVLHQPIGDWQSTLAVTPELGLTSSRDVLESLATDARPAQITVALGYSGWGAGQLERELAENAWLTVPADTRIIFDLPCEERLPAAMERLGIDITHLAGSAGHA